MPQMSGPDLAARVAAIAPIPVLFMSGYADDALDRGTDASADLLSKPFTPDELLGAVRRTIDEHIVDAIPVA
jgi:CheY-like chemotaxis protein